MKTLAFGKTSGCVVFVCGKHPIDDREWDNYLLFLHDEFNYDREHIFLVHTAGAGPTAAQRQRVNDVISSATSEIKAAVMTSSQIARGIVTVLAWIYPVYRSFSPSDVDEAIRFLGVPESEMPKLKQLLADLKEELVKP